MMKKLVCIFCALFMVIASSSAVAGQEAAWSDFAVELDGTVYVLPAQASALTADGWTIDDADVVLQPNSYTLSRIKKGEKTAYASIINMGINDAPAADCLVGGLSLDDYDAKKGAAIRIAGVTLGDKGDDLIAAWGQPSRDSGRTLSYEIDSYERVEASVDSETQLVTKLDARNFVAPKGYNDAAYAAPVEVPECVTAYQAPASLGEDWTSFTFTLNGTCYRLPVPVAVMAENGWKLNGNAYAPKLAAHESDFGWKLQNGAQALESVGVENQSGTANTWENAMVTTFRASGYAPVDIVLPGGITLSSKAADVEAALAGREFTKNESGHFVYYEMKLSYGNSVTVAINTETDAIVSIEMSCDGSAK